MNIVTRRRCAVAVLAVVLVCSAGGIYWFVNVRQSSRDRNEGTRTLESERSTVPKQTIKSVAQDHIQGVASDVAGRSESTVPPEEKDVSNAVATVVMSYGRMENDVMNQSGEDFGKRAMATANTAQAMERYLAGKEPSTLSIEVLKQRFGTPTSQSATSLVYRFDTGLGGVEWEFAVLENEIKGVARRSLN